MTRVTYDGFSIDLPDEWADTTADFEPGAPLTFTRTDVDSGALQLSIASYKTGARPNPTTETLRELLSDFARSHNLKPLTELRTGTDPLLLTAGVFTDGEFIFAVWYLSDGTNFALATHTKQELDHAEIAAADSIVRTLTWRDVVSVRLDS